MTTLISTNPAKNYEAIGEVAVTDKSEITAKVAAANAAKTEWRNTPLQKRIDLVSQVYKIFQDRKEEIAIDDNYISV